ncbi:hypothetical protein [Marinobacterium lutimaris]|uniref:Uncharacterized protein n=1 Tax=Marinobacterium lutimaris TaxID=568106 RepID=A0A1H5Z019_9GAMM|nr:hypothetical protein [Marinobacterium lutimaris]SEG29929.1 hypothetical protein SAMN05444390_1011971 [Marinobacterium lutimaris]
MRLALSCITLKQANCLLLAIVLLTGCTSLNLTPSRPNPGAQLSAGNESSATSDMDMLTLQSLVMSMADEYVSSVSEVAFLHLRPKAQTSQERVLIQSFMRNSFGAATEIAAGRNPDVALLDLLVLVRLQRQTFKNYWIPNIWGEERGHDALAQLTATELALWQRSSRLLTPEQQATLRELIDAWVAQNPDRLVVELIRFDEFADARWMPQQRNREAARGLLQELDAAVSTIDEALLFAERAMWYSGRLTYIAGEQAELSAYRILATPEVQEVLLQLANFEQILTEFQATLGAYPQHLADAEQRIFTNLSAERQRAIDYLFERFSQERAQIFSAVSSSGEQMAEILPASLDLINATANLASMTNEALINLDGLMARIDTQFPSTPDADTDFSADALELVTASSRLASQLQLLLPRLQQDLDTAERFSTNLADYLFWRLVALIAFIFCGIAALRLIPGRKA